MKTNSPYHHESAVAPSAERRRRWPQYFVRLNTILISVPLLIVGAAYLWVRVSSWSSSIQFSGASGTVGQDTLMVGVAYFAIPNLLLAVYAVARTRRRG